MCRNWGWGRIHWKLLCLDASVPFWTLLQSFRGELVRSWSWNVTVGKERRPWAQEVLGRRTCK